jgi:hypothetical protein
MMEEKGSNKPRTPTEEPKSSSDNPKRNLRLREIIQPKIDEAIQTTRQVLADINASRASRFGHTANPSKANSLGATVPATWSKPQEQESSQEPQEKLSVTYNYFFDQVNEIFIKSKHPEKFSKEELELFITAVWDVIERAVYYVVPLSTNELDLLRKLACETTDNLMKRIENISQ